MQESIFLIIGNETFKNTQNCKNYFKRLTNAIKLKFKNYLSTMTKTVINVVELHAAGLEVPHIQKIAYRILKDFLLV